MNSTEAECFGVLRFSDRHELWLWEIARDAHLGIQKAKCAVHGLKRAGLVKLTHHRQDGGLCSVTVRLANRARAESSHMQHI